jgi:hypothetical protein
MESEEILGQQFSVHCQPVSQSLESDFLSVYQSLKDLGASLA